MLGDKIMAGYVCKIVIEDSHPPIWRRVIISDKVTFFDVHRIIQILFGWEDMHLHEFTLPSENIVISDDEDVYGWREWYDEKSVAIDEFFNNYKWIRYTYDFGDDWRHKINIEKYDETYNARYVKLLKTKGDNFVEDCGGVWCQFEELYDELDDADNIESGIEEYYRSEFNKEIVERKLGCMSIPVYENEKNNIRKGHEEGNKFECVIDNNLKMFKEALKKLAGMNPEVRNNIVAEVLDEYNGNASDMTKKLMQLRTFIDNSEENGTYKDNNLCIARNISSQKELLMSLGEKEAADYYKYLGLPQDKLLSKEEKISAITNELINHPEYIMYIYNEKQYDELVQLNSKPLGYMCNLGQYEETIVKTISLGLGSFSVEGDYVRIGLASDIDKYIENIDKNVKKKVYKEINKLDDRVGSIVLAYGMLELESLYDIYRSRYYKNQNKEDFYRYVYWHARYNNLINTFSNGDGKRYVSSKYVTSPENIVKNMDKYVKDMPYIIYTREQIVDYADDIGNWSEWIDILYDSLVNIFNIPEYEANDILIETLSKVISGYTIDQIFDELFKDYMDNENIEACIQIWETITGLMLEIQLPMLKGRNRIEYADEKNISAWSLDMVSDNNYQKIGNKEYKHMYEFPADIQCMMYSIGNENVTTDSEKKFINYADKLMEYKNKENICSEEYIYDLAFNYLMIEQYKEADGLIKELEKISKLGKKMAKELRKHKQIILQMPGALKDEKWNNSFEDTEFDDIMFNDYPFDYEDFGYQQPYVREYLKIGRNDPCPCGSGKKYKKCCGKDK